MRMIVFFDLPVNDINSRRAATRFRNFLLKDGYYMVQFSVYSRICLGNDSVETHKRRLKANLPDNGAIRLLTITEKQYENIEILLGAYKENDEPVSFERITLL